MPRDDANGTVDIGTGLAVTRRTFPEGSAFGPAVPPLSVAVVILTWRAEETTRACLRGLTGLSSWPLPTLIVDNASGTGEGERLAAEFGPPVTSLTRAVNDGVPGGYNAGLHWASQIGASHVLLLNNDVEIRDTAMVDRLLEAAGPRVAAVGPIVLDSDGSVFSAGGFIDFKRGRWDHWKRPAQAKRPYAAAWLDGSALLVAIEAARAIGGLAPEYFMYAEELDWCIRAGRAGYRCMVQPATSIVHRRSTRMPSPRVRYLLVRNGLLFMRRNGTAFQNATSLVWLLAWRMPGLVWRAFDGEVGPPRVLRIGLRAIRWNVIDAARRRGWRVRANGPRVAGPTEPV